METAKYGPLNTRQGKPPPGCRCTWDCIKDYLLVVLSLSVIALFVAYGTSMHTISNLDDDLTKLKRDFYASSTVPAVQLEVTALNTTLHQTIATLQQLNATYTDHVLTSPYKVDSNGAVLQSDNIYIKNGNGDTIFWINTFGIYTLGSIAKIRLNGFNRPIDEMLDTGTCAGNSGVAQCV